MPDDDDDIEYILHLPTENAFWKETNRYRDQKTLSMARN